MLSLLDVVVMLSSTTVECRHAQLRRYIQASSQTHFQDVEMASASFVFARQRIIEHNGILVRDAPEPQKLGRPNRLGSRRGVGRGWSGGAQRAVASRTLKAS